jgi:hypothetical protein
MGYRLYRDGALRATPSAPSYADTGLSPGETHTYAMLAFDYSGNDSALSDPAQGQTQPDLTAPAAIANLAVTSCDAASCLLSWTAPGDDGSVGTAAHYDLRYGPDPIADEAAWESATPATGLPVPSAAGTAQTFRVANLGVTTT